MVRRPGAGLNRPVGLFGKLDIRQTGRYSQAVSRRASDAAPVRDRILQTATDLFYREGIQAVGIQRLIDEAGIAKASLYAHFQSKEDVVAAYLARWSDGFRERIGREIGADLPPRERILALFDYLCAWITGRDFRGCPFQNAGNEFPSREHPVRAVIERHRQWLHELLRTMAVDFGAADPEALAGALLVIMDGAASTTALDLDARAAHRARWAAELLLDAASPRPARARKRRTPQGKRR